MNDSRMTHLYIINLALLVTHEIDSAFWKEWDLFGLPGGIELFLALNFFLAFAALFGLKQLLAGNRSGCFFSLFLVIAGIGAFFIHGWFLLTGHPEFKTVASIVVLVLIFIVSVMLGALTIGALRKKEGLENTTL